MFVEAVEHRRADRDGLRVVVGHRQAAADDVEPWRLGCLVTVIGQVGLVHDPSEIPA